MVWVNDGWARSGTDDLLGPVGMPTTVITWEDPYYGVDGRRGLVGEFSGGSQVYIGADTITAAIGIGWGSIGQAGSGSDTLNGPAYVPPTGIPPESW